MQFFYSATNGSDTGSVVAAVVGNEATANLSDLLPATTYTVYGVVTATNGSTPQSSSTTFTTEGARTDHAAWYELPARTTADETITQTVYPASGSQRNYTMYYDKSTYTAYWVAYPLAKGHMGNGRSDKWQRNPGLAESEQINVWSSSYGVNLGATTSDGYDNSKEFYARGHQIPNADRNGSDELVVQTYYATNSTPQIQNKFNGGIWQQLESGVRNIAATTDTVYVVTGAILQTAGNHEAITWITPKSDSKRCPVPNYYYKALLKVRRDASNKVTSAMTIGFWMEHREYSNDSYTNYATSVAEIERLTGFDFFANLPADIQAAAEQNSNWSTIRIVLNGRKNLRYDKTTRIIPFDACRFVLSIHPNGSFFRKNSYLYESENRRIRKPTLEADATKRREYSVASEGGKPQISDRRGP